MVVDKSPIVLLVDDDSNDEELARIALESMGIAHRLVVRRDGVEALEYLDGLVESAPEAWPVLIMLDLKLPKITGLELLAKVRGENKTKTIPIVVFTSSTEIRDLDLSYALGANAYIRKPIDFTDYRKTVEDMGRFWILRNRRPPRIASGT